MNSIQSLFIVLWVWLGTLSVSAQSKHIHSIPFRFATRAEAQMLITNIDQFTTNWNQFDVDVRLQTKDGKKSQLLTVAMNATRNWSDEEKQRIGKTFKSLESRLKSLKANLPFPEEIVLIKTSMMEEGAAAAYTRENWIAIGEKALTQMDETSLQYLIAHELFHVLTRNNLNFKKAMYQTIGFTVANQEIRFPADITNKRISNPDISKYDSYAPFTINGKQENCVMMIYTNKEYDGGSLFDYLNVGLIPLNEELIPLQTDGETTIYPLEAATDFYEKIGKNTEYVIHPEEALADNFAFTVTGKKGLASPEIIEKIKNVLLQQF